MARGDSTSDDKSRNHNRNNLDLKDGAFFTFNVKDTGFPPLPPQQPNFQPNLRSRRPQQNGYKATPGQIEGGAEVDEARALFNASARNGKSFAVVVYGESGNIEGQVRVPRTLHQRPQIELAITQFAGTTISDSSDRRHDSIEQSSEEYSRGNSLSSSSTQCTLPVRNHQTASRRKKRRASTPLSRCGTPADDEEEQEIVILEDKPMRTFRLGNVDEIRRFYRAAFDLVQQTAMKSILKYWIKVIEPDKQKKFPYSHGAQPPWWPKDAKYKEPDHIRSDDRLKLGVAILKVVVETGDRAMIKSLEKVTFEKASIVGEKDSPEKIALRKEILKQVFHLARREQEVYNDEIDGSAQIILFELAAFKAPTGKNRKRSKRKSASKHRTRLRNEGIAASDRDHRVEDRVTSPADPNNSVRPNLTFDICDGSEAHLPSLAEARLRTIDHMQPHWRPQSQVIQHDPYHQAESVPSSALDMHQHQQIMQYPGSTRFNSFDSSIMDMGYQIAVDSPMARQDLASVSFSSTSTVPNEAPWAYPDINMQMVPVSMPAHGLPVPSSPQHLSTQQNPMIYAATWQGPHRWAATPAAYPPTSTYRP